MARGKPDAGTGVGDPGEFHVNGVGPQRIKVIPGTGMVRQEIDGGCLAPRIGLTFE